MNLKRIIMGLIVLLLIIGVLSFTIGREIVEGKQPTLDSFAVVHFSGYLFFILMPVELLVPYYLSEGYSGITLIIIALITAIIAQLLDYSVGFLFSDRYIKYFVSEWRYRKAKKTVEKYGDWAILIFNLFPLSSPIIVLAAGMMKFSLRRVILYSFTGLVVKYIVIVSVFGFF